MDDGRNPLFKNENLEDRGLFFFLIRVFLSLDHQSLSSGMESSPAPIG